MKFFLLACCCFITSDLLAQSPKAIEADLLKSYRKIDYWYQRTYDTTSAKFAAGDSLSKANNVFGKKLKDYTTRYPSTIIYPFNSLIKEHLDISSSIDGLFRIYSWDTYLGGTEHDFRNVLQYKSNSKTNSILELDTSYKNDDNYVFYYSKIYTYKRNNKTYYLGVYNGIFSSHDLGEGIRVFSINNGKLANEKLIKTQSGLHNELSYYWDYFSAKAKKGDITFDPLTGAISLPVVVENGKVTNKRILYKFTGQYFERVKN
jgi:hypothetical protein